MSNTTVYAKAYNKILARIVREIMAGDETICKRDAIRLAENKAEAEFYATYDLEPVVPKQHLFAGGSV